MPRGRAAAPALVGSAGLLARPALTVSLVVGFVLGAYLGHPGTDGAGIQGTYASLFEGTPVIDLKTNGQDGVRATIGGLVAPGDVFDGSIVLSAEGATDTEPYDLDIGTSYALQTDSTPKPGQVRLDDYLYYSKLVYGREDLLKPPGRDLIAEIDANPLLGNGDGRLSFAEFRAGVNDLAPPGPPLNPTPLLIEVTAPTEDADFGSGQTLDLTFTFFLADVAEADLN